MNAIPALVQFANPDGRHAREVIAAQPLIVLNTSPYFERIHSRRVLY
jgi:hypothetical protein